MHIVNSVTKDTGINYKELYPIPPLYRIKKEKEEYNDYLINPHSSGTEINIINTLRSTEVSSYPKLSERSHDKFKEYFVSNQAGRNFCLIIYVFRKFSQMGRMS